MTRRRLSRPGFTLAEFAAGMVLFAAAGYSLARLGMHAAAERMRVEFRGDAADAAADALEAARAAPWNDLSPDWGARQSLPPDVAARLPDGKLTVEVAAEPAPANVKRVTARVTWTNPGKLPARPVTLVGLFAGPEGGTP